jgi:GAF domain-containing protein
LDYKIAENKVKEIISQDNSSKVLQDVVDFLYENFDKYSWVGIYVVEGNDLLLDSWKGEQATEHTSIPIGEGVCGSAAKTGKTELIPDVNKDSRYLSCFVSTRSEIVVPIKKNKKTIGEIDIDSNVLDAFDEHDALFLEKIAEQLSDFVY